MDRRSLPPLPLLGLVGLLLITGAPRGRSAELPALPDTAVWRQLQLAAQNCGRENSSATCQPARSQADGLLDHPRLSAACKDALWEIRERSEAAAGNSYARREALNQVASRMMVVCRPSAGKPAPPATGPAS
ncbi:MAG: hypothetical protein ACOVNL_06280 [Prochlorococcaceae cyanobacterium]|jgi:hypothetical protein